MKNSSSFGCFLLIIAINIIIGSRCFSYMLWFCFGKDAPWWADVLGGLVLGEIVIPGALVCWILSLAGVSAPLVGG